jgi:CDP-diacylglycerol--serine O-phosphatidyltransferase
MYFWTLSSLGRLGWLICLIYVICVALRLARFNINSNQEASWRDNFFEGVPSPAGGILVLTPLVISMTNFELFKIDNNIISPIFFIVTSLLLISKFPTYSFKKIVIQRQTTIFLLFGIVLFFGFILIYPFIAISISAILYLLMLPISYFHYNKLKKQNADKPNTEDDDFEDIL